jgi:hypothetical protein
MVKSREQFTEDVQIGNAWEPRLWGELSKYLPTLTPPQRAVLEDGSAVSGFQYTPDTQLTTMCSPSVATGCSTLPCSRSENGVRADVAGS